MQANRVFNPLRLFCSVLISLVIVAAAPGLFAAEPEADAPASIVITYKARPENRAAFRTFMEKKGAAQFAQWQKEGVFLDFHLLFTSYAGASSFDMAVILDFAHYTDLARWKEIEKRMPGGLPSEALALGSPDGSWLADLSFRSDAKADIKTAGKTRDYGKAAYMMAFYQILTDAPRYNKYVEGYTVPQMKGWIEAGVLSGYRMYLNQGVNTPWDALLVLEYKDLAALAQRETVKTGVRQKLTASDPVWKAWSTDKTAIRKETSLNIADAIVP